MKPLHPIDTSNTSFSHIGFETVEAPGEGLRPDLQDQSSATADPTYKTQGGEALYDLYKKTQQASWSEFLAWNGILVDVPKNVILPAGMTIYLQDPSTLPMSDNDSPDISLYLDPDVEMPRDGGLTVYTETLERSLVHQHLETLRSTGKRYGFDLNHFQRDNTALSHDGVFFQQAFNGLVDVLGEDGALEVLAHAESTYRTAVMQSQGAYLLSAFEQSLQAQQQSKVLFKQEYGETWGPIMLAFASHAVPGGGGGWDLVMLGGFGAAAPRALPGGARPQMQFIEMRRTLNDGQTLIRRKDLQTN